MRLVEILESRKQALRVSEVATLFAVTSQHIYKMTAKGMIPEGRSLFFDHAVTFVSKALPFDS